MWGRREDRALEKWYGEEDIEIKQKIYNQYIDKLPAKPYPPVDGIKLIMETYDSLTGNTLTPPYPLLTFPRT